ncbi:MAG: hypothetical protein OIN84_21500, partial [Candidatus Methanoperedens sp.]|nr:hypothetical protein [Candidatus Methanoperedens sp.]
RILKHCLPLYRDAYFKDAAREAMTQVETALKEKGIVEDKKHGQGLIDSLFTIGGKNKNIKLRVPFSEALQDEAKALFKGAFAYYRNYCAHDGSKIDKRSCLRILVLASELLDLIDASWLSYTDLGGIDGIIEAGIFSGSGELVTLLGKLDGRYAADPDGATFRDWLFDDGFLDEQLDSVIDLGLVRYIERDFIPSPEEYKALYPDIPSTIGGFELTDLGKEVIAKAKGS